MNFKKTALATAVGATLAISGVAQADGHTVNVYGRINNVVRVDSLDNADGSDSDGTNVVDVVSRIGVKASAPINADLTAFGRYEFSVTSDSEGGNGKANLDSSGAHNNTSTGDGGIGDTRIAEVGVKGDFGSVKIGNMWSTFYNIVGTHLDPTVTLGAVLYSTIVNLPYRVSNAIQYSGDFGAVSVSAEMRLADSDNPDDIAGDQTEKIGGSDGTAVGVSWNITDSLLVAATVDSSDETAPGAGDVDRQGFAVKWSPGNWWLSGGWAETDNDGGATLTQTQAHAGMGFGNGLSSWVGYGIADSDVAGDPETTALTFNVTKKFGTSGFRAYYEGIQVSDDDDLLGKDGTRHLFGARIDF
jgi:predicted porin